MARRAVAEALGTAFLLAAVVGFWNHGRAAGRWECGHCSVGQQPRHRRHAGDADSHVRADFGGAPQPGGSRWPTPHRAVWRGAKCRPTSLPRSRGAFAGVAAAASRCLASRCFSRPSTCAAEAPSSSSEFVATFGLLSIIWGCARVRSSAVPFAVGAYITGAYWFTASTSFANPAVTLARAASDTFAGIRPADAPGFIIAQLAGAAAATAALPVAGASSREGCCPCGCPSSGSGKHACPIRSVFSYSAPEIQHAAKWPKVYCATTQATDSRCSAVAPCRATFDPKQSRSCGELGIDISGHRSKSVDEFSGQSFDYVLTVCDKAKESCPIFPGKTVTIHHKALKTAAAFQGSEEDRLAAFRRVRSELRQYLAGFPPSH